MGLIVAIIFVITVVVMISNIVSIYNDLVKSKNRVKNSWAHVDAQLQRRFDLIPNLVETVKGFAIHERQVLESVTAARSGYLSAHNHNEKLSMNKQLTANLKDLYIVVENYPQLKTDAHFLKLQSALTEIEEDISYARQFCNDAVTIYNNKIMMFPNNIVASIFGFTEEMFFDAVAEAEIAPKIKLRYNTKKQCPLCGASVNSDDTNCEYCGCSLI